MTHHCAKFTDTIMAEVGRVLGGCLPNSVVLDPFAGTGRVHQLPFNTIGVELEPEWASMHPNTLVGNALALPIATSSVDVVVTSPTYGNRMADRDMRDSVAGTYAKSLGRHASPHSSCHLQWGPAYREFHEAAWIEALRVLRPGGLFLLNVKDHPRNGEIQRVAYWHQNVLLFLGIESLAAIQIPTPGNRRGANKQSAIDHEWLFVMEKS